MSNKPKKMPIEDHPDLVQMDKTMRGYEIGYKIGQSTKKIAEVVAVAGGVALVGYSVYQMEKRNREKLEES